MVAFDWRWWQATASRLGGHPPLASLRLLAPPYVFDEGGGGPVPSPRPSPPVGSFAQPVATGIFGVALPRTPFVLRTFPPRAGETLVFCNIPRWGGGFVGGFGLVVGVWVEWFLVWFWDGVRSLLMAQVWIDIEDNDNCGYFPMQTFEVRGVERVASSVVLDSVTNVEGRCEVVGWSDEGVCDVRVVAVGDSGAGESVLVYGGNHGIRLRSYKIADAWSLWSPEEFGEPYMLLPSLSEVEFIE